MKHLVSRTIALAVAVVVSLAPLCKAEVDPSKAIKDYVDRPEPVYKYEVQSKPDGKRGGHYKVHLTSQTWQGIVWTHWLYIFEPANLEFKGQFLLYNTGGNNGGLPGPVDIAMGLRMAQVTGMRCGFLFQVPNQPLLGNHVEDDLITETMLRYLKTRDPSWPLLFPMVKSAVKAMDAIQSISKEQWDQPVNSFIVSGASKRGWTTWLSAVADKRVAAIAPIVIDMLNSPAQMKYQIETWGAYSEQIADYERKGLIKVMLDEPNEPLWRWLDPYTFRKQLTLPKLLINGTNDPYWVVDALNNYWDGLVGDKHVLYVSNAAHGLEGGRDKAIATLGAFARATAKGKTLPNLTGTHENAANGYRLRLSTDGEATAALLWSATSPTKDFRKAKWTSIEMTPSGSDFVGEIPRPADGHVALFGELRFKSDQLTYGLSSQIRRE